MTTGHCFQVPWYDEALDGSRVVIDGGRPGDELPPRDAPARGLVAEGADDIIS